MRPHALRPQVAVQLLLWGAIECWQLARARLALQRLSARDDSARTPVRDRIDRGAMHR